MKSSLMAGLGVGLATGTWMFAEYALGLHDDPAGAGRWTGFLSLVFPVLGAYWLVTRSALRPWPAALRAGLVFGAAGGVVGGAAIYLYYAVVNPGFSIGGRTSHAGEQALVGFVGAFVLGTVLTLLLSLVFGRKGAGHV